MSSLVADSNAVLVSPRRLERTQYVQLRFAQVCGTDGPFNEAMRQFNEAILNGAGAGSRSIDTPYRAPSFHRQLAEFPQNLHLHLNEELLTGLVSHTWGYELGGRGSGTDVSHFASAVAISDNSWTCLPGKTRSRTQTNISDPYSPPAPPKRPTMVPLPDFLRAKSSCSLR